MPGPLGHRERSVETAEVLGQSQRGPPGVVQEAIVEPARVRVDDGVGAIRREEPAVRKTLKEGRAQYSMVTAPV